MSNSKIDDVFEQWKINLLTKDRSRKNVESNFDELFDALKGAGATLDEAKVVLPQATKVHYPPAMAAKYAWNNIKRDPRFAGVSEKEFMEDWHKDIASSAIKSMNAFFPLPKDQDDDGLPKVYGSMSAKEYRLQRRHAESYPVLNTEELEKQLQLDVCNPVEHILGKEDNDGESQ